MDGRRVHGEEVAALPERRYRCGGCGAEFSESSIRNANGGGGVYRCVSDAHASRCAANTAKDSPSGNLRIIFDGHAARARWDCAAAAAAGRAATVGGIASFDMRVYWPLLPFERSWCSISSHVVGGTPLLSVPTLAASLGCTRLYVKDESRNPSASLKDRASLAVLAAAREFNRTTIATASSGNAGAALACICASVPDVRAVIFVPHTIPDAKLCQIAAFGARVVVVDGSYDDAVALCDRACTEFGWYNRTTGVNPFTLEGKKTVAFEICNQLAALEPVVGGSAGTAPPQFLSPSAVFVSVGDGNILTAVGKGMAELKACGLLESTPKLYGVQALHCCPIYERWLQLTASCAPDGSFSTDALRADCRQEGTHTIADSIHVAVPQSYMGAVNAVIDSGGAFLRVSDEEILSAMQELATKAGVLAEPAAAAAFAGLVQLAATQSGSGAADAVNGASDGAVLFDSAVVISTGHGLKDLKALQRSAPQENVRHVKPGDLDEVRRVFG